MFLRMIWMFVMLYFCLSNFGCSKATMITTPEFEELKLELELQSLNKPPVKTILLEEGDKIDCIDIYRQPALDNPLLKNHKIQLQPTSFPAEMKKSVPDTDPVQDGFRDEACPNGTVPIHKITKDDLVRAKTVSYQMFRDIGNINAPTAPNVHQVFIRMNETTKHERYLGVIGSSSLYKLNMGQDQSSTANVWVDTGLPDYATALVAGWMVSPSMMGDDNPRLFIYWTLDGGKTGCYNTLCKGFVQVDQRIAPKTPFSPVSSFGGKTYEATFSIYQDSITYRALVAFGIKQECGILAEGAGNVGWGGMAMAQQEKGASPPMGSGQFPDGKYEHVGYFRDMHFMKNGLKPRVPSDADPVFEYAGTSSCYGFHSDKDTKQAFWGYPFSFGGPGGSSCPLFEKNVLMAWDFELKRPALAYLIQ